MEDPNSHKRFGILEVAAVIGILGSMIVAYGRVTDRIAIIETDITTLKANELVNARLERQRLDLEKLTERVNEALHEE